MDVEAVTRGLCCIASRGDSRTTHAIILTDFMILLQNKWNVELETQTGMCQ